MSNGAKGGLTVVAIVAAAILALGWLIFDGSTTWPRTIHYRLTLVVDTPEGERSGSSVVQIKIRFPGGLTRAQGWGVTTALLGEATTVDLGPRGLLFALLVSEKELASGGTGLYSLPFSSDDYPGKYPNNDGSNAQTASFLDELNRVKPKAEILSNDFPMLVRFRDPKDQTSIERVDPSDLSASFGPGVKPKRASIEITDDPVTKTIEARLPWLMTDKDSPLLIPLDQNHIRERLEDKRLVSGLRFDAFRSLYQ
jgi:hypothetical protein